MSFRRRLVIAGIVVAWIPVLCLGLVVRHAGVQRLGEANAETMRERADRLAAAWASGAGFLDDRLDALGRLLADDNDVRIAARAGRGPVLREAAARFAASSGLDVAYLLDARGTILAASHFPGDAGRRSPELAALADHGAAPVVAAVAFPDSGRTVLARARRFDVGGVAVVGVVGEELAALGVLPVGAEVALWAERGGGAGAVMLAGAGGAVGAGAGGDGGRGDGSAFDGRRVVGRVLWQGGAGGGGVAAGGETLPVDLVFGWRDPLLAELTRSFDRVLVVSLAGAALAAVLLGGLVARRFSGPVERLAATARGVHLGRLDAVFPRGGARELDRLGLFLNGMLGRIRDGLAKARDAEKRATLGEFARQANHDVRNGLVPIRNVLGHLADARDDGPGALAEAFDARSPTLAASLDYLAELADQYRAVAVHGARDRSNLRAVVEAVVEAQRSLRTGVRLVADLGGEAAWVEMDALSLRRVVENVVSNAVTAVAGEGVEGGAGVSRIGMGEVCLKIGAVRADGAARADGGRRRHRLSVVDNGPGIPAEVRERVFEPFFTTRGGGERGGGERTGGERAGGERAGGERAGGERGGGQRAGSQQTGGTGLGLAIARRLVRDVGGEISLKSAPGRGTRVDVILRAASPPASSPQERTP